MTPAVELFVDSVLPLAVPYLCQCEGSIATDGTEFWMFVAQFNEFLMSRLHPSTVLDQRVPTTLTRGRYPSIEVGNTQRSQKAATERQVL